MIVTSTGVAVGRGGGEDLAKRIEAAMLRAASQAQAEGLTADDTIRDRMLAARNEVLANG